MSPERWQQVKGVLATALEQPGEEARTAFLASACADDTALRREVCSLLDQPADEFETCAARVGLLNHGPLLSENAHSRVGAYELVRELGRGGMGTVWLARRADEQFEKLVAVKLLKRGTDTDEVLRRFHAERQILARLDHPNISRLLDAGTTDDGLPYFVMEFVDGRRVTDFVREEHLPLRQRLQLFLKICAAVQFAHQNLVIHRDLKPGNILVTAEGEPKLLDFGVAKLLSPSDDIWEMTAAGQERFTPGYASPEQVRGEVITTVSDVYSLGALLYEMLTGKPPHRFSSKTPTATQIAKAVCEDQPVRPSIAATELALRRQLRGDLDTILLRALAKMPARRYRGAGQMGDDLRRYLENRPVRARPDTFAYRAGKFLRRNRAAATAAALVLLSLVGGVIATARQAQIANRERARAERRFNEVRKIANSFMLEFHNAIADLPGALAARQLVTRRALEYLDSLAQEASDDLSLQGELALAYDRIGSLTFDLPQAMRAHEKAVALNEALVQAAPKNVAYRIQLSESYDALSDVKKIAGRSRDAIDDARKSLAVMQSIPHANPAQLAERHVALGIALSNAGDFNHARQSAEAALQIQKPLATAESARKEARRQLEPTYALLSDAYADLGDSAQAFSYAREGLDIAQQLLLTEPSNSRYRRDLWATHFRLGLHLVAAGDASGALENLRPALDLIENLATADPTDTGHRRWLALTYSALGDAQAALGQRTDAVALQEKALAISEKLTRDDPERVEVASDVAQINRALGSLWLAQGEPGRAANYFERAYSIAHKLVGNDPENARTRGALAEAGARLAECDRRLAEIAGTPALREAKLRAADQLRRGSLDLWQQLKAGGMLTARDGALAGANQ
jgi:non-specific serine/threonine protein kinase/serine/threonine-protein kinase